jgi:preprotein translocase subunit SecG
MGMSVIQIISSIMLLISSVVLIIIVLSQHGRSAYLGGAIAGGAAESFLGKNKGRTLDAKLTRVTKWIAITFVVLTVAINVFIAFKI